MTSSFFISFSFSFGGGFIVANSEKYFRILNILCNDEFKQIRRTCKRQLIAMYPS